MSAALPLPLVSGNSSYDCTPIPKARKDSPPRTQEVDRQNYLVLMNSTDHYTHSVLVPEQNKMDKRQSQPSRVEQSAREVSGGTIAAPEV